jgi:hypothetical protein
MASAHSAPADGLVSMERVQANGTWTLFDPNEAPGLHEVWGDKFKELYHKYESEGRGRKTIEAQKLWYAILEAQIETGGPFICYKDAANGTCGPVSYRRRAHYLSQPSPTSRTSVPSSHRTCARRSWSTRRQMRPPCATSARSPCPRSLRTARSTSRCSTRSSRSSL